MLYDDIQVRKHEWLKSACRGSWALGQGSFPSPSEKTKHVFSLFDYSQAAWGMVTIW